MDFKEIVVMKRSNYYKETVPRLIEEYKKAVERNLEIVGEALDDELKDDKLLNALRGKKEAGEQVLFYAKEVERLENEINGIEDEAKSDDPLDEQRNKRSQFIRK